MNQHNHTAHEVSQYCKRQLANTDHISDPILINSEAALAQASELISAANGCGLFLSVAPLQSREAIQLSGWAKRWVNMVKARLSSYTPGEALMLADAYDIVHRIAFRQPADRTLLNGVVLRAFDAMIHGDKGVDEYAMFHAIRSGVSRRDKAFFDKPLTWSCISEERWYEEASRGYDRRRLSDYDILSRVTILLTTDLFVFEGRNQQSFKKRLFERHRHYLDSHDTTDPRILSAVTSFLYASTQFLTPEEFETYRTKLTNSPDNVTAEQSHVVA